jgi:hypothetical protein
VAERFAIPVLPLAPLVAQNEAKQAQAKEKEKLSKAAAARAKGEKERVAAASGSGVPPVPFAGYQLDPSNPSRVSMENEPAAALMYELDDVDLVSPTDTERAMDEAEKNEHMEQQENGQQRPFYLRQPPMPLQLTGAAALAVSLDHIASPGLASPLHVRGAPSPSLSAAGWRNNSLLNSPLHSSFSLDASGTAAEAAAAIATEEAQQRLRSRIGVLEARNIELEKALQAARSAPPPPPSRSVISVADQASLLSFCNDQVVPVLFSGWMSHRAALHAASQRLERLAARMGALGVYQRFLQEQLQSSGSALLLGSGGGSGSAMRSVLRAELERRLVAYSLGDGAKQSAAAQAAAKSAKRKSVSSSGVGVKMLPSVSSTLSRKHSPAHTPTHTKRPVFHVAPESPAVAAAQEQPRSGNHLGMVSPMSNPPIAFEADPLLHANPALALLSRGNLPAADAPDDSDRSEMGSESGATTASSAGEPPPIHNYQHPQR